MKDLIPKQKELMERVPHPLTPNAALLSKDAIDVIDKLLVFINACGRKPWRPNPLPEDQIRSHLQAFRESSRTIAVDYNKISGTNNDARVDRLRVSTLGVIEEAVETFNESQALPIDRVKLKTEITDIIFFYLELMIELGFSWEEIKEEYHRKWQVNMKRYADAKKGNYDWDDRGKKESL